MSDGVVLAGIVTGFAGLVTAHLAILVGLVRRKPRWHALVALLVPPLAPYWALRASMMWRFILWVACALGYIIFRVVAASSG